MEQKKMIKGLFFCKLRKHFLKICLFNFILICTNGFSATTPSVSLVNKNYDRIKSKVLIRKVTIPTRANLDYAAYAANVMISDSTSCEIKAPAGKKALKDLSFNNTLLPTSIVDRLSKAPLTETERMSPMAYGALKEYLLKWNFEKSQKLVEMMNGVTEERWENDELCKPAQEPCDLYLEHKNGSVTGMWVKIEFKPWIKFLKTVDDEDKDGFPEIYGKINPDFLNPEMLTEISDKYVKKVLSKDEIITWSNELASFWYPTYNTDNYKYEGNKWPDKYVEPEIVKELNGLSFDNPLIVIKGKPFGYPLYQLILVEGMQQENVAVEKPGTSVLNSKAGQDPSTAISIAANLSLFKKELEQNGNSYEAWAAPFKPFYGGLNKILTSTPIDIKGFEGKNDFLFFRNSYNYIVGGDLGKQPEGKNPLPVIIAMNNLMKSMGVDFIFIPAPVKPEIYPEETGVSLPNGKGNIVNPYSRKFLKDLSDAGVDVVDLYTPILAEKAKPCKGCETVYQHQDTHWADRGLEVAAKAIADRIKKYGWYSGLPKTVFTVRDTTFSKTGDIVSRLAISAQTKYKPENLKGAMVVGPENKLYDSDKNSPILFLGDSFLGMYELTDCRHAGVSAHVAKELGVPLYTLVSYGGGPTITQKIKRMGKAGIAGRKLVVWLMVARDLYNYHENWEKLDKLE